MPADAKLIIGADSLKSKPESRHRNPMTTYEMIKDGNKSDQKSALNALRPIKPPQKNTTRTTTANASRVWSVGFGLGVSGKKQRNTNAEATAATKLPTKKSDCISK